MTGDWLKRLKVKGGDIAFNGKPISELWSITCHMGSHSVTCHPTQVNVPLVGDDDCKQSYSLTLLT